LAHTLKEDLSSGQVTPAQNCFRARGTSPVAVWVNHLPELMS
jgi:hypothetical protein